MDKELPGSLHHIKTSGAVLALRIILAVIITDLLYALLSIGILGNIAPFSPNARFSLVFLLTFIKVIVQSIAIVAIILLTQAREYFLTEKQLILRKGVINRDEEVYELHHISSVKRHESIFAKILGFGDIRLTIPPSGKKEILLNNIRQPKKYEKIFMEVMKRADSTVSIEKDTKK